MARTSKTMLKSSGKSRYPCLVPDLSGNSFSFSPLRMMLAVGLSYMPLYYVEVGAHILKGFYQIWVLDFVKGFFLRLWRGSYGFILQFVNVGCHTD